MQPINMIIIYYSDKKLPKRLHFLEADMITFFFNWRFEVSSKDTFIRAHVQNDRRCASDTLEAHILEGPRVWESSSIHCWTESGHHPEDSCHQEGRVCQGDWQLRSSASSVSEAQRRSFGTCALINVSFELTSNILFWARDLKSSGFFLNCFCCCCFLIDIISASRKCNLFGSFLSE